jgi:hypothetical protein
VKESGIDVVNNPRTVNTKPKGDSTTSLLGDVTSQFQQRLRRHHMGRGLDPFGRFQHGRDDDVRIRLTNGREEHIATE